jgi:hypothetical protein
MVQSRVLECSEAYSRLTLHSLPSTRRTRCSQSASRGQRSRRTIFSSTRFQTLPAAATNFSCRRRGGMGLGLRRSPPVKPPGLAGRTGLCHEEHGWPGLTAEPYSWQCQGQSLLRNRRCLSAFLLVNRARNRLPFPALSGGSDRADTTASTILAPRTASTATAAATSTTTATDITLVVGPRSRRSSVRLLLRA